MTPPQRYISKPKTVEAMQWTGENMREIQEWVASQSPIRVSGNYFFRKLMGTASLWVRKSCAWVDVYAGGWIIKERDGTGFYPCSAEDFEASYEREEDAQ